MIGGARNRAIQADSVERSNAPCTAAGRTIVSATPSAAQSSVAARSDAAFDTAYALNRWAEDASRIGSLAEHMSRGLIGRTRLVERLLVGLLANGHLLIEGAPGLAKTRAVKLLAEGVDASFVRIQCTPDLMPADLTGTPVFRPDRGAFEFVKGPVFHSLVLVDEINRTTPKVQSALLEAMAEKQVTVDNTTHKLDPLFFVIATQNPLDAVGTYPLPLAQLDRFLFKIKMRHISRDAELEVLRTWGHLREPTALPKVSRGEIVQARRLIRQSVFVSPAVQECLVDIARALRSDKRILQGVSTRSLVLAIPALQTLAMLRGRDFVAPEDVEHLAVPIFQHRMELVPGVEDVSTVIRDIIKQPLDALARQALRGK